MDLIFWDATIGGNGIPIYQELFYPSSVPIRRHVKIRSDASPFNPLLNEFYENRKCKGHRGSGLL